MFYKEFLEKDQEICRLKDHSQKLLAQISKTKVTKPCNKKLEQVKEDLEKKFKKNLTEKDEKNSCLRNLNQRLLEQIRRLKYEKHENRDIKQSQKIRK
jgi:hypothetical protein